ncbi:chemotaxis protein CheW [Alkalilimnicola sp. S0819]|uniref:chemotaxis protein CheW n=1 Tax=Alkalilimnicola sp. S0819 TaxID=2613922 RepID=UPI0012620EFB|nr:chemotaxis protein CheW [Alkalilimnicola sp. S0819]KAB7627159.1 chemotaxis protein CheW [Alkalilimnicola sp. S0819]MPQ15868.1 chemotaxis protein CheW [Alkalilimnicola sp. S0819]
MSNRPERKELLVDQREAVLSYLDGLLREIPEDYADEPAPSTTAPEKPPEAPPAPPVLREVGRETVLRPASDVEVPAAEPLTPLQAEAPPAVEEPPAPPAAAIEPETAPEAVEERPHPTWAEPDFQALLFQVGGLRLAVPLVKLHSVVPWSEEIRAMPNQPEWCHGLFRYRERNVRVVDTAELVLPADKREGVEDKHILIVGDGRWGLACTSIGQVVRLGPDEVKWRQQRGKRAWLAGTVLGHLCALMDTEAFADMLGRGN